MRVLKSFPNTQVDRIYAFAEGVRLGLEQSPVATERTVDIDVSRSSKTGNIDVVLFENSWDRENHNREASRNGERIRG